MNAGHRHDVIDGTSDHWNWKKTIKLRMYPHYSYAAPETGLTLNIL